MSLTPLEYEAPILENRPVGSYFKLVLGDPKGHLGGALPGQFISLKVQPGTAPLLRRPFSIARLERSGKGFKITVLYAVLREGTRLLSLKRPGETVGVLGPLGGGFPQLDKKHPALLVSGGIGVAPILFLCEHLKRLGVPQEVFLGARTADDLIELDLFRKTGAPLHLATDDGSAGRKGFVTDLLDAHLESGKAQNGSVIHACGPRPMFRSVTKVAKKHGVRAFLSWEESMACGLGICLTCACPTGEGDPPRMVRTCVEGPVFDASTIRWEHLGEDHG